MTKYTLGPLVLAYSMAALACAEPFAPGPEEVAVFDLVRVDGAPLGQPSRAPDGSVAWFRTGRIEVRGGLYAAAFTALEARGDLATLQLYAWTGVLERDGAAATLHHDAGFLRGRFGDDHLEFEWNGRTLYLQKAGP